MPNIVLAEYDEMLDKVATKKPGQHRAKAHLRSAFVALVLVFLFLPIIGPVTTYTLPYFLA